MVAIAVERETTKAGWDKATNDYGRAEYFANKAIEVQIYDGVHDHAREAVRAHREGRDGGNGNYIEDSRFTGRDFGNDWDRFAREAVGAWEEGAKTIQRMKESIKLELAPRTIKRYTHWREDAGDDLSIDRFERGQPFWRSSRRDRNTGPGGITIAVNLSAAAFRTPESLFWRGAAAAIIADVCEAAGYAVEIHAIVYTEGTYTNGAGSFQAVCAKRPGDYLDIGSLATVVSGWYFRIGFFSTFGLANATPACGLGVPSKCPRPLLKYIAKKPEDVIVIENVFDEKAATALIEKCIIEIDEKGQHSFGGVTAESDTY